MYKAKSTTPNAPQMKLQKQVIRNNGVGESFRVLYYGTASSVPFVWESQPGTPKHALIESSLPPLTPPPSYFQFNEKYNSSKNLIHHTPSKRSGFLRTIFVSSRKRNMSGTSFSSCSISSSSSSASSYLHSSQSTPSRKKEVRSMLSPVKFGLEDEFNGGCLGGRFKKGYRIKKVMMSFVRHVKHD